MCGDTLPRTTLQPDEVMAVLAEAIESETAGSVKVAVRKEIAKGC